MRVEKISDTIQKFDGVSYYRCGPYFQKKGKRLHRTVWEYHNGPIPEGHEVHHVNGDRADNDIENLQLMPEYDHHSLHMQAPERKEQARRAIAKASEKAKEWHGTPEGVHFHSLHAKEYWGNAQLTTYTCTFCGKEFQTVNVYGPKENRFCCNAHKSAWRRKQGLDDQSRICPICGKAFTTNRYSKQVCCSRECARKLRWGK